MRVSHQLEGEEAIAEACRAEDHAAGSWIDVLNTNVYMR